MASQITSLMIVYSTIYTGAVNLNIKALCHWPSCGEFTSDWGISSTKGQQRGKCFHFMTSSWVTRILNDIYTMIVKNSVLQRNGSCHHHNHFVIIACTGGCQHDNPQYNQLWWRHQMETFSVLLALCAWNSPVTGEFPAKRPVTLSFDVFFDLRLNQRLSKQSLGWWFETPSRSLWL